MTPDILLCLGFATFAAVSYVLWALGRLASMQLLLAVASLICLVSGAALHGDLFSARATKPSTSASQP